MSVPGIPHTILVAPDSFKGTQSAVAVAEAIGRGLEEAGRPVERCPVADGGEGTTDVLLAALGGERVEALVHDPLGREITAEFALISDPGTLGGASAPERAGASRARAAIVETAAASGLQLVASGERDPLAASTYGTGELIAAALAAGARTIYVGVGGSATTDGGRGAIEAIRDAGGVDGARLLILSDVRTRFEDAARVFGPQKGADAEAVRRLTRRLHGLARGFRRDPRGTAMTGAAGGLAGGLWAAFDATLVSGASFILDALDFDTRMRAARAVVTGEGRLDDQSLAGKAVSEVATRARQSGVPCHAIVGKRELDSFGTRILDLQAVLEAGTPDELVDAGHRLAPFL